MTTLLGMLMVVAGAQGYVLKQVVGPDLLAGIRAVANGRSLLAADLVANVRERLHTSMRDDDRVGALAEWVATVCVG